MSKARPRVTSRGTYMPKPYQEWRRECADILKQSWGLPPIDHPIAVEIDCYGTARGDIDNYMGALFDCGNRIIWADDRASIIQKATISYYKRSTAHSCWILRVYDLLE
ncbi:MAG: RusA family crossover junction endodeoxyribonuclease [Candidatus Nanopelagicaceae bacterium]